jgi:hypothetical protein
MVELGLDARQERATEEEEEGFVEDYHLFIFWARI